MIRVIMFEDDVQFRKSLKAYWKGSSKIYVTADFENADNAVAKVRKFEPDVVLMDIKLPGISGLNALKKITDSFPDTKVLILTNFPDNDKIFAAICNGAKGYVLKSDIENIEEAIKEVNEGGGHMSPTIALRVFDMLQSNIVQSESTYVQLTRREKEVLGCMVDGKSYKMIADHLSITYNTVNDHVKRIYKKLHVNSAPEAVREAIERRLV